MVQHPKQGTLVTKVLTKQQYEFIKLLKTKKVHLFSVVMISVIFTVE